MAADFEFLSGKGFVEPLHASLDELVTQSTARGVDATHFAERSARLRRWQAEGPHWTGGRAPRVDSPLPGDYAQGARERVRAAESAMCARLYAVLQSTSAEVFTPILREDDDSLQPTHGTALLQVVVSAFPVPAEDVGLEELLEFKRSAAAARDHELFRRWLRTKVRDETLSADALAEELADLLSDHREHMRLARLKARDERLYTLLTAPVATVERLAKLQFSKLLDPFFELRKTHMQLLEAEAKSPAKEVAYVHRVTQAFA